MRARLLAVLLLFDYWSTPCPTQPGEVSPFYGRLDFAAESLWDEVLGRLFAVK